MKNKDVISTPHDHFFKSVLSDISCAAEFIQAHVPESISRITDFNSLRLTSSSFIDDELKMRETDLLYQVNFNGEQGYFYILLEHQSTPDITMTLRCARYIALILERHLKEHKTNKVPYICPIVLYNGKTPYPYPTDIREMLDAPKEISEDYRMGRFHIVMCCIF